MKSSVDFLVIGSGLAGLALALKVAHRGRVLICSKAPVEVTNTAMAQGGIAAVMSEEDSLEKHVQDTLVAGAGLCQEQIVRMVVEQGPDRIQDLVNWGVRFDLAQNKAFALTREGGHSMRRILHFADHTGQEIHSRLLEEIKKHPNIEILENQFAIDLITSQNLAPFSVGQNRCLGAYLMDSQKRDVYAVKARTTILATGGAGKVYRFTSNWSGATGDGIAMAYRAGARVGNLEFMQFHPTCLYHPQSRNFLISEALRGEGGELINDQGEAFMKSSHKLGSLAPRDIVARSIDAEMKKTGAECVYLDMTHLSREFLQQRFPVIFKKCKELGIDISTQAIPVVPAAHYLCGGVITNSNGETDIHGLFALGETALTGLHGANRLASNSLLECLVFAHNSSEWILSHLEEYNFVDQTFDLPPVHQKEDSDELIVVTHMWDEIRRLMWNYVGIVRSQRRLERAKHRLEVISSEIKEYYSNFRTHPDIEELRNIALVAKLTVECALKRKESRGIHFNIDCPETHPELGIDSILR